MPLSTAIINDGQIAVPAHQLKAALTLWAAGKGTRPQATSTRSSQNTRS